MMSMQTIAIRLLVLIVALTSPCVAHAAANDGDSLTNHLVTFVVGWFLGLSGNLIVDEIRRRQLNKEVRSALKIELMELQNRMALAVYGIRSRLGINRDTVRWVLSMLQAYEGLNKNPQLQALMDKQLAMSDQEFGIFAEIQKTPDGAAISLMKYSAPQLETKSLSGLEELLQNRLSEVRVHIGMFNEEVDHARYYLRLTFEKLSDANHDRAVQNLNKAYENVATRAKIIADHISLIRWPV
jgi:hypothetical protein